MDELAEGTILYHGSYCVVDEIDLSRCNKGKDFGRGFYLTTSYEQARKFVRLSVRNAACLGVLDGSRQSGFVNSYELWTRGSIFEHDFHEADTEWLHFVAGNRDKGLFCQMIEDFGAYNVIGGRIANDRTAATLNQYVNGAFGMPGDEQADEIAIKLLPNRLENQYCFRDEAAVACLRFMGAEEVGI